MNTQEEIYEFIKLTRNLCDLTIKPLEDEPIYTREFLLEARLSLIMDRLDAILPRLNDTALLPAGNDTENAPDHPFPQTKPFMTDEEAEEIFPWPHKSLE